MLSLVSGRQPILLFSSIIYLSNTALAMTDQVKPLIGLLAKANAAIETLSELPKQMHTLTLRLRPTP